MANEPGSDLPRGVMAGIVATTLVITAIVMLVLGGQVPHTPTPMIVVLLGIPALVTTLAGLAKQARTQAQSSR